MNKGPASYAEHTFVHRIIRYTPSAVRDEWLNIGVLVFDPETGEFRLRLIDTEEEYRRVRRLLPQADETELRRLQEDLENKLEAVGQGHNKGEALQKLLKNWEDSYTNGVHFAAPKGTATPDLDAELNRLYEQRIAVPRLKRTLPGTRGGLRSYCANVFQQARVWNRLEKSVRAAEFTFPGDPMRLDFAYRRNGTRGLIHTLSVTRSPGDCKMLAYTAQRIREKIASTEFTCVTDVPLSADSGRHRFVRDTLRDVSIEAVAREGLAVWVAKLRPALQ